MKNDPQTGISNVWAWDIATGKTTAITNEIISINSPVWSHDGKQIAYVLFKDSYGSVYRKAAAIPSSCFVTRWGPELGLRIGRPMEIS